MLPEEGDIEGDYDGLWLFRAMHGRGDAKINFFVMKAIDRQLVKREDSLIQR
jgi:hypothetical protein